MERITIDCTPAQLVTWTQHMTTLNDATLNSLNAMLLKFVSHAQGGTEANRSVFDTDANH